MELVPQSAKNLCITFMCAYDASNLMVACLLFKYLHMDFETILSMYFIMGLIAYILYVVFIPESPKWLFMKKGRNNQQAIKNLNYISKFNGSSKRLPKDGIFDLIG